MYLDHLNVSSVEYSVRTERSSADLDLLVWPSTSQNLLNVS